MVPGIQTREVVFGDRGGEVIAAISAEGQKCFRHDGADGVQPFVIWSGPAKAVAIEAGDGAVTASLQGSSEDVGGHRGCVVCDQYSARKRGATQGNGLGAAVGLIRRVRGWCGFGELCGDGAMMVEGLRQGCKQAMQWIEVILF